RGEGRRHTPGKWPLRAGGSRVGRAEGHDRLRHLPRAQRARLRTCCIALRRHACECALLPRTRLEALMTRSVLVTGGSGYFGSLLAERALEQGDAVRIFDVNPPAVGTAAEYAKGDVRDRGALRAACEGIDVVFHNVAQV